MFSKKAILEAGVYLLGDEEIDEEDFLAIYEIATKRTQLSKAEHFSLIVLLLVSSSKPETGVSVGDRK